jgi:hypothetical protein
VASAGGDSALTIMVDCGLWIVDEGGRGQRGQSAGEGRGGELVRHMADMAT